MLCGVPTGNGIFQVVILVSGHEVPFLHLETTVGGEGVVSFEDGLDVFLLHLLNLIHRLLTHAAYRAEDSPYA
jgi:hypothetical protein